MLENKILETKIRKFSLDSIPNGDGFSEKIAFELTVGMGRSVVTVDGSIADVLVGRIVVIGRGLPLSG